VPKRKKPMGQEYEALKDDYYKANHAGRVALARRFGIHLDSLKHWISQGDTPSVEPDDTDNTGIALDGLLVLNPAIKLDFVSFDIETSGLQADFAITLCACIKPFGQPPVVFRADDYPEWNYCRADDHRIIADIVTELSRHAIVIGHYGSRFDIPFIRAKSVKYGLPLLPPIFGIDTWLIARQNFRLASRRLKALSRYFDLGQKSDVEGPLWMDAAFDGNKEALDAIVEHNIVDCELLEKLACITFPYLKSIRKL